MASLEQAQAHESKLYYELSHVYDRVFSHVFGPRIQRVIRSLSIEAGARVIEVGAGTGLSFPAYPSHSQVVGIDLAPEMLERARYKIHRNGWRHLNVLEMDALDLTFADNSFDYAMAFHVVSVVPDAGRLLREMLRVTKPGGTVVIINHFRSRNRLLAGLDRLVEPLWRRLGWHTLGFEEMVDGLPLRVEQLYKFSRNSLFTIVVGKNGK